MARYATGQYARFMSQGGMIAYVLDGRCEHAIELVENNIRGRHEELAMEAPGGFLSSKLRPENSLIRETEHSFSRVFRLHHIFLGCPVAEEPDVGAARESS